ncbi:5-(carboxyamino)imidazole ribonucleotide mutase [Limisalsivibrio acetivorans]|uniref:5-(carboxyamino)imidazole ribonucleotide mutase n=1 Tax=Limisalsivibrio acetivorans TaxID=1304888 RepID=UPI0003B6889F|nr:5-(carboxyamino)imidazole ribonucleotide mutase [Limisalsivibrio acetivorans]
MSKVGIIMGSKSDLGVAETAINILDEFEIPYEVIVSSAHRTPERTGEWSRNAQKNGFSVIIAIAGAAAHLAGVVASETNLPVIAVPVSATSLGGIDALLSMVQMPGGIPVATMAIGSAGAKNAAIFSAQILAVDNYDIQARLKSYRENMRDKVYSANEEVQNMLEARKQDAGS